MQVRQDQNQDQDGINTKSTMRSGLGSEAGSVVNQDSNLSSVGIGIGKTDPRIYRFKRVTYGNFFRVMTPKYIKKRMIRKRNPCAFYAM